MRHTRAIQRDHSNCPRAALPAEQVKDRLQSAFLAEAPVSIVVCGRKDVWDLPYDTSAAIENMLLMVTALGLGACWVIAPCIDIRDEERLKELLGVPEGLKIVSIVAVGHSARYPRPRPRIPLHELVYREKWGVPYYEKEEE